MFDKGAKKRKLEKIKHLQQTAKDISQKVYLKSLRNANLTYFDI